MKFLTGISFLAFVLFAAVSSSYAQGLGNSRPATQTNQLSRPLTDTTSGTLAQRATSEIDRQISSLQSLTPKVDTLTHLTPAERATVSTQVQTEITNLQTLKSRISGNTEEANVKANIKSILDSHKNFSFYMPQVRLLIAAEAMDALSNRMLEVSKKIEVRLESLDTKDSAAITPLLENMKAKLNNAKAQSNAITAAVSPLQSTNFPANKATLQSAQTKLKTGMGDIRSALQDLKEILKMLREKTPEKAELSTPSTQTTPVN